MAACTYLFVTTVGLHTFYWGILLPAVRRFYKSRGNSLHLEPHSQVIIIVRNIAVFTTSCQPKTLQQLNITTTSSTDFSVYRSKPDLQNTISIQKRQTQFEFNLMRWYNASPKNIRQIDKIYCLPWEGRERERQREEREGDRWLE